MSTNAKKKQKMVEKGGVDWLVELSVYEMNETKKKKQKEICNSYINIQLEHN